MFLQYELQSEADRCCAKTNLRLFSDNVVTCHYFEEELFKSEQWDAPPIPPKKEWERLQKEKAEKEEAEQEAMSARRRGNVPV